MTNVQQIEMFEDLIEKVQNVANAIPPANSVPDVESTDNGKVLKATYSEGTGSYDWEDAPNGLPSTQFTQTGDVLTVNEAGDPAWITPSSGLPTITSSDNGKVLTSIYDDKSGTGYAEWQTPSGGGGLTIASYSVDATDFTQEGTSYQAVFDSQGAFTYSVADIVSARIYYAGAFSVPCSIYYIDKTGWAVAVSADDYRTFGSQSGLTIKISLAV
ncbi:MAG: hypothetical protein J6S67_13505 [Methanobrevibacter sp.]|nr:hypothetical protein [Methanobrevibacter sp.]